MTVVGRIWGEEGANGDVKVGLCNVSLEWVNGELGNGGRWGKKAVGNE